MWVRASARTSSAAASCRTPNGLRIDWIMDSVILNIDGHEVRTLQGKTILEIALGSGIYIPHLCHHPDLPPIGSCRLCIVEVDGVESPVVSCSTPAVDGMKVTTRTEQLDKTRRREN